MPKPYATCTTEHGLSLQGPCPASAGVGSEDVVTDLVIYLSIKVDEQTSDGGEHTIIDNSLYLSVPPEVALDDATKVYLMAAAEHLVKRALVEMRTTYKPEEATP